MGSHMQPSTPLCKAVMMEKELSAQVPQGIPEAHARQPKKMISENGDEQSMSLHMFFQDALLYEYLVFWA